MFYKLSHLPHLLTSPACYSLLGGLGAAYAYYRCFQAKIRSAYSGVRTSWLFVAPIWITLGVAQCLKLYGLMDVGIFCSAFCAAWIMCVAFNNIGR